MNDKKQTLFLDSIEIGTRWMKLQTNDKVFIAAPIQIFGAERRIAYLTDVYYDPIADPNELIDFYGEVIVRLSDQVTRLIIDPNLIESVNCDAQVDINYEFSHLLSNAQERYSAIVRWLDQKEETRKYIEMIHLDYNRPGGVVMVWFKNANV